MDSTKNNNTSQMFDNYKNLIGASLIAISFFMFFSWVLPNYDAIKVLRPSIQAKEIKLAERQAIVDRLKDLSIEYDQRSSDIDKIAIMLPLIHGQPEIISSFEDISSKSGMILKKIDLFAEENRVDASLPENLQSILVSAELDGSYISFVNFLDQIEKNMRIMDVISFEVASLSDSDVDNKLLSIKIKTRAYFIK